MSSLDDKRENGSVMLVIGWVMILFAVLVMYFHPAALRLGQARFGIIAASLAVAGLVLSVVGVQIRRHNR